MAPSSFATDTDSSSRKGAGERASGEIESAITPRVGETALSLLPRTSVVSSTSSEVEEEEEELLTIEMKLL